MVRFGRTKLVVYPPGGHFPRPGIRAAADRAAVRAAPPGYFRGPPPPRRSARPDPPAGRGARGVQAYGDDRVRPTGGRRLRGGTGRRRQRGGIRVPGPAQDGGRRGRPPPQPHGRGLVSVFPAAPVRLPLRPPTGPF